MTLLEDFSLSADNNVHRKLGAIVLDSHFVDAVIQKPDSLPPVIQLEDLPEVVNVKTTAELPSALSGNIDRFQPLSVQHVEDSSQGLLRSLLRVLFFPEYLHVDPSRFTLMFLVGPHPHALFVKQLPLSVVRLDPSLRDVGNFQLKIVPRLVHFFLEVGIGAVVDHGHLLLHLGRVIVSGGKQESVAWRQWKGILSVGGRSWNFDRSTKLRIGIFWASLIERPKDSSITKNVHHLLQLLLCDVKLRGLLLKRALL
mmetsp:Transcript_49826/g.132231  ORF Transcript_49826/g.132231 Transcript_49826/m.132231 type:complete len:255 (+) Transcript_49826:4655-5419(+)